MTGIYTTEEIKERAAQAQTELELHIRYPNYSPEGSLEYLKKLEQLEATRDLWNKKLAAVSRKVAASRRMGMTIRQGNSA